MRAVVFADSDALSDGVLAAYGNRYLVFDAIRWLSGDESIAGEVSSETDVPIAHTRKQDQAWFYACIFVVPLMVLGVGFLWAFAMLPGPFPIYGTIWALPATFAAEVTTIRHFEVP